MSDKTIITEVTPTLHTFSRQFSRFGLFKIGARSAVLVLSDGSLAITSPISISQDRAPLEYVRTKLGGNVKLLIAPDLAHYLSLSEWTKEFPNAKVIGVEGHGSKAKDVKFDTLFSSSTDAAAVAASYGVAQDLDFCYFAGFAGKDLVTLHRGSKSIVEADLIFNLPAKQQYGGQKPGGIGGMMNILRKDGDWSRKFIWQMGKDKADMTKGAKTVASWDFDNIVPCHGDVMLGDGKTVWHWIFERYLKRQ